MSSPIHHHHHHHPRSRQGHLFCRECIITNLVEQKIEIKRKEAMYNEQQAMLEVRVVWISNYTLGLAQPSSPDTFPQCMLASTTCLMSDGVKGCV